MTTETNRPTPALPPTTTSADVRRWFNDGGDQGACPFPAVSEFISRHCSERYFVTLTDRRKLSSQDLSRHVAWTLHKTNQAFFGTAYKRHRTSFLATYAVQETTFKDGLHTHLVVGIPDGLLALKPNKPAVSVGQFLTECWVKADRRYRSISAQDWKPVTNLDGAFGYTTKAIWSLAAFDQVDVGNTTFPTTYAVPDRG